MENLLQNMLRVGYVSTVNAIKRTARVVFPSLSNMVSGDLPVLQHNSAGVHINADGEHTHMIVGGSVTYSSGTHDHDGSHVTYWMPAKGQAVLCIFIPVENGDGFILGGL